jgi:hypothetical protein
MRSGAQKKLSKVTVAQYDETCTFAFCFNLFLSQPVVGSTGVKLSRLMRQRSATIDASGVGYQYDLKHKTAHIHDTADSLKYKQATILYARAFRTGDESAGENQQTTGID